MTAAKGLLTSTASVHSAHLYFVLFAYHFFRLGVVWGIPYVVDTRRLWGAVFFSELWSFVSLSFSIQTLNLLIDCLLSETNAVGLGGALTDL